MSLFSTSADALAVSTSGVKTLIEVNQIASRFLVLKQWSIEFDGVTASNVPVQVQLVIVTATSAAGSGGTIVSMKNFQAAAGATSKTAPATEGTVSIIEAHRVPPTSGLLIQYPLGEEPFIIGAASTASGIAIRALAGAAVNAAVTLQYEE